MTKLQVAVIMGGISSEREVSLRSGANAVAALDTNKYDVTAVDFTGDVAQITALGGVIDVAVLMLHGPGGEDGRLQGLLDLLHIPYTGSGVLGSALAMHKGMAKAIYRDAGIPTPKGIIATIDEAYIGAVVTTNVGFPCVVKPANEGSTVGISLVSNEEELEDALSSAFAYDNELVIEEYVRGMEISVPVLGTEVLRALPAVEIVPKSGWYDYEMKYTVGATEEICPARLTEEQAERAAELALKAHRALGLSGISRTDMIVTDYDVIVLETNTLPGMTDTSLVPLCARTVGISFSELMDMLIDDARGSKQG